MATRKTKHYRRSDYVTYTMDGHVRIVVTSTKAKETSKGRKAALDALEAVRRAWFGDAA